MAIDTIDVLIGGVLALTGSFGATWLTQYFAQRTLRRNLASAFGGEIMALMIIAKRRNYTRALQDVVDGQSSSVRITVGHEYFKVYNENVASIGVLPNALPGELATFYTCAQSIVEDFRSPIDSDDQAERRRFYRELKSLLEETMVLGERLIPKLNAIANNSKQCLACCNCCLFNW